MSNEEMVKRMFDWLKEKKEVIVAMGVIVDRPLNKKERKEIEDEIMRMIAGGKN